MTTAGQCFEHMKTVFDKQEKIRGVVHGGDRFGVCGGGCNGWAQDFERRHSHCVTARSITQRDRGSHEGVARSDWKAAK